MLGPVDYIISALGITFIVWFLSKELSVGVFLSIGMLLLFFAFFQIMNIDGSWPRNQPRNDNYKISSEKLRQLDSLTDAAMSSREWDDYIRCKKLNVCVRRFSSLAESRK